MVLRAASRARRPAIVIANYSGYILGDDAIFESLCAMVRRVFGPQVTLYALTAMPERTAHRYPDVRVIGHVYHYLDAARPRAAVLAALAQADLLIVGGGDIVEGQRALFALAAAARAIGTPICFAGVGILRPRGRRQRLMLRGMLAAAKLVLPRDTISASVAHESGTRRARVSLVPDLAVALPEATDFPARAVLARAGLAANRAFVAINVREPDPGQYGTAWGDAEYQALAAVCRWLIDERGLDIVGIPLVTDAAGLPPGEQGRTDDAVLGDLALRVRRPGHMHILREDLRPAGVSAILGQAHLALGMRLHFVVLAANAATPIVALSYARKVRSFMESAHQTAFCLEAKDVDAVVLQGVLSQALSRRAELAASLAAWRVDAVSRLAGQEPALHRIAASRAPLRMPRRGMGWLAARVLLRVLR